MSFPVFDLHCDTALALMGKDLMGGIDLKKNKLHIDLERASRLPGYAQCFACFTTPAMREWHQASPLVIFEREMGTILSEIERNNRKIRLAYTAQDVRDNFEKGMMSAEMAMGQLEDFLEDSGMSFESDTEADLDGEIEKMIDATGAAEIDALDAEIDRKLAESEAKRAALKE